jgi:hypothetical protein
MARFIMALFIAFTAQTAFASGKLTLQNNLYNDGTTYRPTVGFGVYERLFKGLAVNAWTGYGVMPLESSDDTEWFVAKAQIDFEMAGKLKNVTVSPGIQHKQIVNEDFSDNIGYLKIDWKLW